MTPSKNPPVATPAHRGWLEAEERRLLDFGAAAVRPDGAAAWLDAGGRPDPDHPAHTYLTARLAHVYFLAALRGVPGAYPRASALLGGLDTVLRDSRHGGWLNVAGGSDADEDAVGKQCYAHAFVVLAGATATAAQHPDGPRLLAEALAVTHERFFEPAVGLFADTTSRDFTRTDPYRGLNANMHMVEALLAATDATGDPTWAAEAAAVCAFTVDQAEAHGWRIPEHYDTRWQPLPEYNADEPADQFKPYGATIGHAFEWSRLLVQAAGVADDPARFLDAARRLAGRAAEDGWARAGHPGFSYTTDWSGHPVVDDRLHWVPAEAVGAAAALWWATGEEQYRAWYRTWWDHIAVAFVDREQGSWHHQLDATNQVSHTIWDGKPDVYHAYQCVLLSLLPPAPSVAGAVLAAGSDAAEA